MDGLDKALIELEHHLTIDKVWGGTQGYIHQPMPVHRKIKCLDIIAALKARSNGP